MKVIRFGREQSVPVERDGTVASWIVRLALGHGDTRVSVLHIEPGGVIDPHRARFGQLLMVIEGSGWAKIGEEEAIPVRRGDSVFFPRGRMQSKGSEEGMVAVMIQTFDLRITDQWPT